MQCLFFNSHHRQRQPCYLLFCGRAEEVLLLLDLIKQLFDRWRSCSTRQCAFYLVLQHIIATYIIYMYYFIAMKSFSAIYIAILITHNLVCIINSSPCTRRQRELREAESYDLTAISTAPTQPSHFQDICEFIKAHLDIPHLCVLFSGPTNLLFLQEFQTPCYTSTK